jgi:hypothetical protein
MSRHDATGAAVAHRGAYETQVPTYCSTSLCLTTSDPLRVALALLFSLS